MRKFLFVSATTIIMLAFVFACQREFSSAGNGKEIIVIADSADYVFLKDELRRAFNREIPTPL
ncbi:MAG: hypothetical protein ACREOI_04170 [bacterium]